MILALVWMIPTVLRLKNIGKSGWWALLSFIPIGNLYIAYLCFLAPEGYTRTRKLDTPAFIILGVIVLIFVTMMMAFFLNR